tara:strand:- start:531 stop:716 length:186 start_codon:yes stop_codon:yes gene_type:complete
MKTMRKGDTIVRAEEQQVNHYLRNGYSYCPKNEWKTQVRDAQRTTPDEKRAKKKAKKAKKN